MLNPGPLCGGSIAFQSASPLAGGMSLPFS
jgi:hypothetical protein